MDTAIRDIIDGCSNVKWWHRILSGNSGEFFINGYRHYQDFVAYTRTGVLVFIEFKGKHLDGKDSHQKSDMAEVWDMMSSSSFKYYVVFKTGSVRISKMIRMDELDRYLGEL